ncbi:ATP-binding cassette domain-containing protein [Bordetella sp. FB-8]|uniref:ABC transporter ATP-binding protein n=1 Tax=Bordetella sp. FB-8 TaxID=1159870 RepID=UPI000378C512|nr:ATP-binding cassette domain-containing protein [Bordetella sp. FB-8]
MTDTLLIETRAITRRDPRSGQVLLHPTDFSLRRGERVTLVGPSGSGKSVFMRALALLDPLDGGAVHWRGKSISHKAVPAYRRHAAYLRQRPALLDGTVEENLRYPYSLRVYRGLKYDPGKARDLLVAAGRDADALLGRQASELSGGEAQVVALARTLQLDPQALLLDEPTASLDPDSALAIEALIARWLQADPAGRATLWISHDPAQALRVGTRHVAMSAGGRMNRESAQ